MDIQIDISNIILETERLILRQWKESDLEDFYAYASVPGVGEMAGWHHHESRETSQKILDSFIKEKHVFAVVCRKSQKVIGSLGLHPSWANEEEVYKHLRQKEIGYVLSKAYWGMGLIPEAVGKVLEYCFENLDLEAVTVGHFKSNDQSRRVIEKCGFRFVKTDTFEAKQLGKAFENLNYILLRDEWRGRDSRTISIS